MKSTCYFDSVLYAFPQRIKRTLEFLPDSIKEKTQEIRIRTNLPLCLTIGGKTFFVTLKSGITDFITRELLVTEQKEVMEAFLLLCANSVYAHQNEIKKGYIIMRSGHRAGVCGTVIDEGMRDISSINIRIAREVEGCADILTSRFDGGGILIAGPPGSGKTTLLRDVIRQLSDGVLGNYKRIAVIDSRGELSGSHSGKSFTKLGTNTDILLCEDKANAALMALRTMYPDIIAFDEIGTAAELKSVSEIFNAGVSLITTAHIGVKQDLLRRSVTKELLKGNIISQIAVLPPRFSGEIEFLTPKELIESVSN